MTKEGPAKKVDGTFWRGRLERARSFHDTVRHVDLEYARGTVHANSAEGFNDRVRRTIAGVFLHISPGHADLYFSEVGFRWSLRTVAGQAPYAM